MYRNLESANSRVLPVSLCSLEGEPSWIGHVKRALFFINILILLGVSYVMVFGIVWIINKDNFGMAECQVLHKSSFFLIFIGALAILICLFGFYSTITHNRTVFITYLVFLIIKSLMLMIPLVVVLSAISHGLTLNLTIEKLMNKTLAAACYEEKSQIWEILQKTYKCCGLKMSKKCDFSNGRNGIPKLCCVKPPQEVCESIFRKKDFFSTHVDGCHTKILNHIKYRGFMVIIILCLCIFCSIINLSIGSFFAC